MRERLAAVSDATLPITYSIVGVQKAATSTLFSLLVRHDEVARPAHKELHVFDDEKRDWSAPDLSDYRARVTKPGQRIAGDSTPSYLYWPKALERMHAHNPDMLLIASFRDPIERAFSHWMMQVTRQGKRSDTFPDFDSLVLDWSPPGIPEVKPDGWTTGQLRNFTAVARGFYGRQLERGLAQFPREQWLLIDFIDVVKDEAAVASRLTDFLGLSPYGPIPPDLRRHPTPAVTDRTGPSAEVLQVLAERYADDLALFERLSGLDTSAWPTRRLLDGDLDASELAEKLGRKAAQAG